jgi:HEAT repeat protein
MRRWPDRHILLLAVSFLGFVGTAHGAGGAPPRLTALLGRSRLAIAGTVTRLDRHDDGRVSVARLRAERVLKGEPGPGDVAVIEEHDLPSSVPKLEPGAHVVVLLQRAERTSALAHALPAGPVYWRLLDGQIGLLRSPDASAGTETAALAARIADTTRDTSSDPATRAQRDRTLVFDEIAARHFRLVADGAAGLAGIPSLATSITDAERGRVERALARTDLPDWTRLALVDAVAGAGLTALVPTLRSLPSPSPAVLAASWRALARLGQPVDAKDLATYATNRDPAIRAVVPTALLAAAGDDAIPQVESMALRDADTSVRRAAVDALGATKRESVIPSLERIYRAGPLVVQQAAGAAFIAVGGHAAAESAARLAFDAPADAQRGAVTILLAVTGRDDPLVTKIRETHPDHEIRELLEHGAKSGHEHPG